jgi:hypothetical protein
MPVAQTAPNVSSTHAKSSRLFAGLLIHACSYLSKRTTADAGIATHLDRKEATGYRSPNPGSAVLDRTLSRMEPK